MARIFSRKAAKSPRKAQREAQAFGFITIDLKVLFARFAALREMPLY